MTDDPDGDDESIRLLIDIQKELLGRDLTPEEIASIVMGQRMPFADGE